MSERYSVQSIGGGEAFVYDSQTDAPVKTQDGLSTYVAPTANAQWTADMMNRTASVAPEAAPVAPEEESEPSRPRNDLDIAQAQRRRIKAAQERREARESAHSEPTDADGTPIDYDGTPIAPAPVVRPVEKVDYPRMAGKAIGSIGVLSGRLASIGRWLDALEDGSVSPEFAMRELRKAQTEARQYAEDIYEELSAR